MSVFEVISWSVFSSFGLNTERYGVSLRENADQNISEYEHFSCSAIHVISSTKDSNDIQDPCSQSMLIWHQYGVEKQPPEVFYKKRCF